MPLENQVLLDTILKNEISDLLLDSWYNTNTLTKLLNEKPSLKLIFDKFKKEFSDLFSHRIETYKEFIVLIQRADSYIKIIKEEEWPEYMEDSQDSLNSFLNSNSELKDFLNKNINELVTLAQTWKKQKDALNDNFFLSRRKNVKENTKSQGHDESFINDDNSINKIARASSEEKKVFSGKVHNFNQTPRSNIASIKDLSKLVADKNFGKNDLKINSRKSLKKNDNNIIDEKTSLSEKLSQKYSNFKHSLFGLKYDLIRNNNNLDADNSDIVSVHKPQ